MAKNWNKERKKEIIIIIIIIIISLWEFFTPCGLHWGLSDIKFPQVSRNILSILADFNSAVVCIDSILPLISIFHRVFSELTFMFHIF